MSNKMMKKKWRVGLEEGGRGRWVWWGESKPD
jgi:hypothetical protein